MGHSHTQKHVSYKKCYKKYKYYVQALTKVSQNLASYGVKFLKRILIYLYSNKYNEINV